MNKIIIGEDQLSKIINDYCSCGGRGPNDDPCVACAIWHAVIGFANIASQPTVQADAGQRCICGAMLDDAGLCIAGGSNHRTA